MNPIVAQLWQKHKSVNGISSVELVQTKCGPASSGSSDPKETGSHSHSNFLSSSPFAIISRGSPDRVEQNKPQKIIPKVASKLILGPTRNQRCKRDFRWSKSSENDQSQTNSSITAQTQGHSHAQLLVNSSERSSLQKQVAMIQQRNFNHLLQRKQAMRILVDRSGKDWISLYKLTHEGANVCLTGPSGSGKTSYALAIAEVLTESLRRFTVLLTGSPNEIVANQLAQGVRTERGQALCQLQKRVLPLSRIIMPLVFFLQRSHQLNSKEEKQFAARKPTSTAPESTDWTTGVDSTSATADLSMNLIDELRQSSFVSTYWIQAQAWVIDDLALVSETEWSFVNAMAKLLRQNNHPFGGLQIIAMADFAHVTPVGIQTQLPPHVGMSMPTPPKPKNDAHDKCHCGDSSCSCLCEVGGGRGHVPPSCKGPSFNSGCDSTLSVGVNTSTLDITDKEWSVQHTEQKGRDCVNSLPSQAKNQQATTQHYLHLYAHAPAEPFVSCFESLSFIECFTHHVVHLTVPNLRWDTAFGQLLGLISTSSSDVSSRYVERIIDHHVKQSRANSTLQKNDQSSLHNNINVNDFVGERQQKKQNELQHSLASVPFLVSQDLDRSLDQEDPTQKLLGLTEDEFHLQFYPTVCATVSEEEALLYNAKRSCAVLKGLQFQKEVGLIAASMGTVSIPDSSPPPLAAQKANLSDSNVHLHNLNDNPALELSLKNSAENTTSKFVATWLSHSHIEETNHTAPPTSTAALRNQFSASLLEAWQCTSMLQRRLDLHVGMQVMLTHEQNGHLPGEIGMVVAFEVVAFSALNGDKHKNDNKDWASIQSKSLFSSTKSDSQEKLKNGALPTHFQKSLSSSLLHYPIVHFYKTGRTKIVPHRDKVTVMIPSSSDDYPLNKHISSPTKTPLANAKHDVLSQHEINVQIVQLPLIPAWAFPLSHLLGLSVPRIQVSFSDAPTLHDWAVVQATRPPRDMPRLERPVKRFKQPSFVDSSINKSVHNNKNITNNYHDNRHNNYHGHPSLGATARLDARPEKDEQTQAMKPIKQDSHPNLRSDYYHLCAPAVPFAFLYSALTRVSSLRDFIITQIETTDVTTNDDAFATSVTADRHHGHLYFGQEWCAHHCNLSCNYHSNSDSSSLSFLSRSSRGNDCTNIRSFNRLYYHPRLTQFQNTAAIVAPLNNE